MFGEKKLTFFLFFQYFFRNRDFIQKSEFQQGKSCASKMQSA